MNEIKQLIEKMDNDNLMIVYKMIKQEIAVRLPPVLTSAERITEYLIMRNERNITSTEIAMDLDMPRSTVRLAISKKLILDKRFNVYLNRKPPEVSYNGGKEYKL